MTRESDLSNMLDIVLSGRGLSEEQKGEIRDALASGDNPSGDGFMRQAWEDSADEAFSRNDIAGLRRLRESLGERSRKPGHSRLRFALAVAAAVVFFVCGMLASDIVNKGKTETTLLVAEGSRGSYTLPDGTRVHMNGGSSLSYDGSFNARMRRVQLDGQAFFEVAKDAARPFVVSMNRTSLTVLGTSFDASNYAASGYESVILRSGSVRVSCPGCEYVLNPGEKLSYSCSEDHADVSAVNAEVVCKWWEDCLVLDNTRLGDALSNIGTRYRMQIINRSGISLDTRLSLTITTETVDAIMGVISVLLPVKYEIHDNTILIDNI